MKHAIALAAALVLAMATPVAAQQNQTLQPGCGPAGGAAGRGGAGRGAGPAAAPPGPARGQQPAPAAGALPATESRIPTFTQAPSPPLSILFESAMPEHRQLRAVIVAQVQQPWSIAFLPDGAMLVTERGGRLRVIRNGMLDPNPVAGVPAVRAAGLQGLMDIVLHPNFAQNCWIYLSYHKPVPVPATATEVTTPAATNTGALQPQQATPQVAGATTIARAVWDGRALTNVQDIFLSAAIGTESSRIGFGRDGMLYMSISAGGTGAQVMRSADPADYAGKTIRIRDDGSIPPDNPFIGKADWKPAIFTYGHRNGHSMALNPETGEFWVTEQGPNGGDEINVLKRGADYGWPYVSHGRNYMGPKISASPWKEGTEAAAVVWIPSIGVTGGTFYTGDVFTGWKRNFFVGGLREGETAPSGQVQRIEFNERWEEIRREPLLRELKQRIRGVWQGPDGLLYVLTAENNGAVLRLEPRNR
jgi:glucose/arabinose dehydrogenase